MNHFTPFLDRDARENASFALLALMVFLPLATSLAALAIVATP
ncbi:hypothetical protein [Metarhizobium album]|nr:hypothetical protein [Rhizobium album]